MRGVPRSSGQHQVEDPSHQVAIQPAQSRKVVTPQKPVTQLSELHLLKSTLTLNPDKTRCHIATSASRHLTLHPWVNPETGPKTIFNRIKTKTERNPQTQNIVQRHISWPHKPPPRQAKIRLIKIILNHRQQHPELLCVSGWQRGLPQDIVLEIGTYQSQGYFLLYVGLK